MNGVESAEFGDKKPFVVNGPGEYEAKQVFVRGLLSSSQYGGKDLINTIYIFTVDNMRLCFLGALNDAQLKDDVTEALDDIDILFVPIGGEGVLEASAAYKLAVSLEPKLIIPMHFGEVGKKDALKTFLKEGGSESNVEELDKLTIKKKDLEGKEGNIVVLKVQ
jgi:L-ascorbate metabolism protein UlaG (beta-lactamase superfamily)